MASNRLVSYGGVRRINGTISGFPKLERCSRHCGSLEEVDRISNLPDEVLLVILSRLDLKQQVSLSVLGHRWTHLWRYSQTLSFVLDDEFGCLIDESLYATLSEEFVHRVNSMLLESRLLAATIDDFTVVFGTDGDRQRDMDTWLRFALDKRVKHLKFDLWYVPWPHKGQYHLTAESISNHRVDSLTSLYLSHVEVTHDFLVHLLSVCPLLEELSIKWATTLHHITASGPAAVKKLKYFVVSHCHCLQHISISDVNHLQSLKVVNCPRTSVFIENTPQLTELYLSFFYEYKDIENAALTLSRLPQLETLTLTYILLKVRPSSFPVFPKLMNLKKLKLEGVSDLFPLGLCACLLEASPYLTEFNLKSEIQYKLPEDKDTRNGDEVKRLDSPLRYLEVVEIAGFVGCKLDLGIAFYIIDNTKFIKKMIITTRRNFSRLEADSNKQEEARMIARELLGTRLPLQTQLTVN